MSGKVRAAVIGPGAIGSFFAAQLVRASLAHVTVCATTSFDTLTVVSEAWGETFEVAPRVVTSVDDLAPGPVDWVLLSTKAHQTAGVAFWLDRLCGDSTSVVVLQNGVEQVERVRPLVGPGVSILPAVVHCGAERERPGRIIHRTNGFLVVPFGPGHAGERFRRLFGPGERDIVRLTKDFVTESWKKLCTNVAANGITALTCRRLGVLHDDAVKRVAATLLGECAQVARACGAHIGDDYAAAVLGRIVSMPETAGTSMLYDRLAGRALECDAIYGAVVRAGRRWEIPTPASDQMYALLAAVEPGEPRIGPQ